jgi:hypothetical protein
LFVFRFSSCIFCSRANTEVVEPVAPLPSAGADNSGGERMVAEATITQVASELQVEAASGDDNVVMLSAERTVPPASAI